MSPFDERFAAVAVPSFLDHFGEREPADDDEYRAVSILVTADRRPFDWPRVIVGKLTERLVENTNGTLEAREACVITGPTSELETGSMPLPDFVQVMIPKYEGSAFHVNPDESEYGGAMTRLSLMRVPNRTLGNFHETRGG